MVCDVSLAKKLAEALPAGVKLQVKHISTRPSVVSALFSASPGKQEERTFAESHLLGVTTASTGGSEEQLLLFAIEVLIFTTKSQTIIFVSKADSTGYINLLSVPKGSRSILRTLSTTFLQFLLDVRLDGSPIVLSLFARAQNQYLFPGSSDNPGKHILSDRQLIKWWCQALDPVMRGERAPLEVHQSYDGPKAHLLVPGLDKSETKSFFPVSARLDPPQRPTWISSYPVKALAPDSQSPLPCQIPRLPDDPKSRFLTDLDSETNENGQWRSIRSLEQFWEMMSYRQECSAGRLVGFIWIVFPEKISTTSQRINGEVVTSSPVPTSDKMSSLLIPTPSFSASGIPEAHNFGATIASKPVDMYESPPSSSPMMPTKNKEVKHLSIDESLEVDQLFYDDQRILPVRWPQRTRGQIIVSEDDYQRMIQHLLQLDFTDQKVATDSTRDFFDMVLKVSATTSLGQDILGQKEGFETTAPLQPTTTTGVNVLTNVRRKRKAEITAVEPENGITAQASVPKPTLDLLHKKQKN